MYFVTMYNVHCNLFIFFYEKLLFYIRLDLLSVIVKKPTTVGQKRKIDSSCKEEPMSNYRVYQKKDQLTRFLKSLSFLFNQEENNNHIVHRTYIIELFAGAEVATLGMEQAGINCLLNEIDHWACAKR